MQTPTVNSIFEQEIVDIVQIFFGYVPSLPAPSSGPLIDPNHRKTVLKMLGLSCDKSVDIFAQPRALLALDFFAPVMREIINLS